MVDYEGLLTVGHIRKAHGLKGEVVVRLTTNRPELVEKGAVPHSAHVHSSFGPRVPRMPTISFTLRVSPAARTPMNFEARNFGPKLSTIPTNYGCTI